MRAVKPITVTLGKMQERVDARVESGAYSSASEVIRAGLRALDREEEMLRRSGGKRSKKSLDDPRTGCSPRRGIPQLAQPSRGEVKEALIV